MLASGVEGLQRLLGETHIVDDDVQGQFAPPVCIPVGRRGVEADVDSAVVIGEPVLERELLATRVVEIHRDADALEACLGVLSGDGDRSSNLFLLAFDHIVEIDRDVSVHVDEDKPANAGGVQVTRVVASDINVEVLAAHFKPVRSR